MRTRPAAWKAMNVKSVMMGIGAVLCGDAAAKLHGNAEFFPASICILFVIFAQLAANTYNRYHDEVKQSGDNVDAHISSHSSSLTDSPFFLKEISTAMLLLACMTGCSIAAMGGWWTLIVAAFILAFGWLMVGGTTPIIRTPWSPLFTFILFGPLTVISVTLIQSIHEASPEMPVSWFDVAPAIYLGLSAGFMAANCNLASNYATMTQDIRNSRYTFTVTFGRRVTRIVFLINAVIAQAIMAISAFTLHLDHPYLTLIVPAVCLAFDLYIWWEMRTLPRYRLNEVSSLTYINLLLMGLISSIIAIFVGMPDDSHMILF